MAFHSLKVASILQGNITETKWIFLGLRRVVEVISSTVCGFVYDLSSIFATISKVCDCCCDLELHH